MSTRLVRQSREVSLTYKRRAPNTKLTTRETMASFVGRKSKNSRDEFLLHVCFDFQYSLAVKKNTLQTVMCSVQFAVGECEVSAIARLVVIRGALLVWLFPSAQRRQNVTPFISRLTNLLQTITWRIKKATLLGKTSYPKSMCSPKSHFLFNQ